MIDRYAFKEIHSNKPVNNNNNNNNNIDIMNKGCFYGVEFNITNNCQLSLSFMLVC